MPRTGTDQTLPCPTVAVGYLQTLAAAVGPRTWAPASGRHVRTPGDRKSTRLNSSHLVISYAVFCLKKKNNTKDPTLCRMHHNISQNQPNQPKSQLLQIHPS